MFTDLLTVPPGFSRGITFAPAVKESSAAEGAPPPQTVAISELLGGGDVLEWTLGRIEEEEEEEKGEAASVKQVMFLFVAFLMFSLKGAITLSPCIHWKEHIILQHTSNDCVPNKAHIIYA